MRLKFPLSFLLLAASLLMQSLHAQVTVSTYAGTGAAGLTDGPAASSTFHNPSGVAVDGSGNIFVADFINNVIRKISSGTVSTYAGNSAYGHLDGVATNGWLANPVDLAVDGSGNVFVADYGNAMIREVTTGNVLSTFAGSGLHQHGTGTPGSFDQIRGLTIDAAGNIYVADERSGQIRSVTPAGVTGDVAGQTLIWGLVNGAAGSAEFDHPAGVAVDGSGNLYVTDRQNHVIRKISGGVVSTFAGSGVAGNADGPAGTATFQQPSGIVIDGSGNLYVTDTANHNIRKITPSGTVSTIAGTGVAGYADGAGASAQFNQPRGIAIDAAGNLYVADFNNHMIRKIVLNSANVWTGAVSTDWNTAGNWTNGVPTSTTDATIANAARQPIVTGTHAVKGLVINAGSSLTVSLGSELDVYGNFTNNGTASVGTGTVALYQATGTQTLSGYSIFGTLAVQAAATYSIGTTAADHISISDHLNLPAGTFNTNNKLTLLASAAKTAYINLNGIGGTGIVNGNVTLQRYIPGNRGYHHICSPVNATLGSGLSGITMFGVDGVRSSTPNQEGAIESYCEPCNNGTTLQTGYFNYCNLATNLTLGQGLTALSSGGNVLSFTGPLFYNRSSANGTYFVSYTPAIAASVRGWNFTGNPFPSPMSWTAFEADNAGAFASTTCYTWIPSTPTTGTWHAFNGTGATAGAGNAIGVGEGFFVLNNAFTGLSFTADQMVSSSSVVSWKSDVLADEIRLTLTSADESAEALSYTEAGRTTGMDDVDAVLPPSMGDHMNATSIAFASEGDNYLINVVGGHDDNTVMPLAIHTAAAGTYTIAASSLNVNGPAYLLDRTTGRYYDLSTESASFTAAGAEDHNNYNVVFKKSHDASHAADVNIYGKTGAIVVEQSAAAADITVTNMLGQVIAKTTANASVTLPVENAAIYLVSVKQNGTETIKKVFVK